MPPVDPIDPSQPQFQGIAKSNDSIAERSSRKVKEQNRKDAQIAPSSFKLSDVTAAASLGLPTQVGFGAEVAAADFNIAQTFVVKPYGT